MTDRQKTNEDNSGKSAGSTESSEGTAKLDLNEHALRLYPERRGAWNKAPLWETAFFGRPHDDRFAKSKCERKVVKALERSGPTQMMQSALRGAGCPLDYRKHISCEICRPEVTGGYDTILNQIVVCYNHSWQVSVIAGILGHEMLHMFDYCRAKLDFNNMDHVMCSEIRAANLFHCSFLSSWLQGTSSPFRIAESHKTCVKAKAVESVAITRPEVDREEIWASCDRVFDRCYADLEPIGRRPRAGSDDYKKAYRERFYYGYY